MSFIDIETFELYADMDASVKADNFSEIHDLLAEPVSKLEKKGYTVAHVNVPAPFPTLHEQYTHCSVIRENVASSPEHCHPVSATFRYTSDGDYRLFICFDDQIKLPYFEPDQWHLHHSEQMLFTVIPSRLAVLDHYAVILERLRTLYAWVEALPEYGGREAA